jgi:hypothetical protein
MEHLRHIVYRDGGSARVRVSAQDANDDALIYQWDTGALVGSVSVDQQVFTISAVSVPAGRYPVLVTVTDGLHVVQRDITIIVEDATPTLQPSTAMEMV